MIIIISFLAKHPLGIIILVAINTSSLLVCKAPEATKTNNETTTITNLTDEFKANLNTSARPSMAGNMLFRDLC